MPEELKRGREETLPDPAKNEACERYELDWNQCAAMQRYRRCTVRTLMADALGKRRMASSRAAQVLGNRAV